MGSEGITVDHGETTAPFVSTSAFSVPGLVPRDGFKYCRLVSSSMSFREGQDLVKKVLDFVSVVIGKCQIRVLFVLKLFSDYEAGSRLKLKFKNSARLRLCLT